MQLVAQTRENSRLGVISTSVQCFPGWMFSIQQLLSIIM